MKFKINQSKIDKYWNILESKMLKRMKIISSFKNPIKNFILNKKYFDMNLFEAILKINSNSKFILFVLFIFMYFTDYVLLMINFFVLQLGLCQTVI